MMTAKMSTVILPPHLPHTHTRQKYSSSLSFSLNKLLYLGRLQSYLALIIQGKQQSYHLGGGKCYFHIVTIATCVMNVVV